MLLLAHGLRLFLVRLGCGFCRTLPDSAEGESRFSLFSVVTTNSGSGDEGAFEQIGILKQRLENLENNLPTLETEKAGAATLDS